LNNRLSNAIYVPYMYIFLKDGAMQVARWGNSLAVRLPAGLVREMGLKEGDRIELAPASDHLAVRRLPSAAEVLADLRRFRGRLPASGRLTRDDANAR
jgi:antitoxin MazE